MAELKISISGIIETYVTLKEAANLEFRPGTESAASELDIGTLLKFLEGYHSPKVKFVFKEFDFLNERNNDLIYKTLFSDDVDSSSTSIIKSFNKIFYDEENECYISEICFDSSNNYCWKRFAAVKEACHVLFLIDQEKLDIKYPHTSYQKDIWVLFQSINTLPFSIYDFSSELYSPELNIENAAEVLAFLLLYSHDNLINDRRHILSLDSEDRIEFDYLPLAEGYKVPRRYMELFLTNKEIGRMLDEVARKMSNTPFDTVPAPEDPYPPIPPSQK